ncbi:MAG: DUF6653 family protein [Pseudomonadota bacterium]
MGSRLLQASNRDPLWAVTCLSSGSVLFQSARLLYGIAAHVLTLIALCGSVVWPLGLISTNPGATIAGFAVTMLAKAWFVDRVVWIFEDMKSVDPRYASWIRSSS